MFLGASHETGQMSALLLVAQYANEIVIGVE